MQSSCQVSFNQCHYTESNSFYITPLSLPWTPMFHFHSFIVGINGVRWLLCTDVAKQKDTGWVGLNKKKATRAQVSTCGHNIWQQNMLHILQFRKTIVKENNNYLAQKRREVDQLLSFRGMEWISKGGAERPAHSYSSLETMFKKRPNRPGVSSLCPKLRPIPRSCSTANKAILWRL